MPDVLVLALGREPPLGVEHMQDDDEFHQSLQTVGKEQLKRKMLGVVEAAALQESKAGLDERGGHIEFQDEAEPSAVVIPSVR
jgi:hypothetical protein